jgi:hypothetical protein
VGSCLLDAHELDELRSLGITAILSLQTAQDTGDRGTDWEKRACSIAELPFRSLPVRDFDTADLRRKLPECVTVLDGMLKAGHTVYLHCTSGTGRSPTVAVAYLHWCLSWPLVRALGHVEKPAIACPTWRPSAVRCGPFEACTDQSCILETPPSDRRNGRCTMLLQHTQPRIFEHVRQGTLSA